MSSAEQSGVSTDRLSEPLTRLLGTKTAAALGKLGLETVEDLLRHYPRRYTSPGTMTDLANLTVGEHVTVMARVERAVSRSIRSGGGSMLQVTLTDDKARLGLTFFAKRQGVLRLHESRLTPGREGLFTGTVGMYRGDLQLTHPDYVLVGVDADDEGEAIAEATRPIPIYPASAAAPTWRIERSLHTVLDPLQPADVPDPLPQYLLDKYGYPSLLDALRLIHHPQEESDWHIARARLRFEEAFVLQTALVQRKRTTQQMAAIARPIAAPASPAAPDAAVPAQASAKTRADAESLLTRFDAELPYILTASQREVGAEIAQDLARAHPMQRLLQGDVGSGKTLVALRAMLQVVDGGGQAVLLAPTEVLAAQHFRNIVDLLGDCVLGDLLGGPLGGGGPTTEAVLVTGSLGQAARRKALLDVASGQAGIIVGTHALLSDRVQFADLGLVVVDEQHRFGVAQRDALRSRGREVLIGGEAVATTPHLLVMTATPIPRTVAMTVFGDLETSVMREMPAGRAGITTHIVPALREAWLARTWQRLREEVDAGRRAFVVCPRIDPHDSDADGVDLTLDESGSSAVQGGLDDTEPRQLTSVIELSQELAAMAVMDGVSIGVLHGRLPPAEKDAVMSAFMSGQVQVLVSTTVIEVGVDVPEASVMVIMDADRFGMAQLHQLRGRVGRGSLPGLCLAVSSADPQTVAGQRLAAFEATTDGFELAAADLELRSEGDVLGASQSGRGSSLRLLRVMKDSAVIEKARADAEYLVDQDLTLSSHAQLSHEIQRRLTPQAEEFLDRS